jgi:hypothetical protein
MMVLNYGMLTISLLLISSVQGKYDQYNSGWEHNYVKRYYLNGVDHFRWLKKQLPVSKLEQPETPPFDKLYEAFPPKEPAFAIQTSV